MKNDDNFKPKIISLLVAFVIFISLFVSFWFMFFQSYFNAADRSIMLGILVAVIFGAFLFALTISNSHRTFSFNAFISKKSPTELKLIACECWAKAGMLEKEIAKELEDRMKDIDDRHNFELVKLKAESSNKR